MKRMLAQDPGNVRTQFDYAVLLVREKHFDWGKSDDLRVRRIYLLRAPDPALKVETLLADSQGNLACARLASLDH